MSLIPSILLTYLASEVAEKAIQKDIEESLHQESVSVSHNIDKMLFERIQNAETWRHLEVTQDIQVKDVDKRLSKFLSELKTGYGDVYLELLCTNQNNLIISSSDSTRIGALYQNPNVILTDVLSKNELSIGSLETNKQKYDALTIRASIPSLFNEGNLGYLYLIFNWDQVYKILDDAAQSDHDVVLVDNQGKVIAGSRQIRNQSKMPIVVPASWMSELDAIQNFKGEPLFNNEVMVSTSNIAKFKQIPSLSWKVLVIKNSRQAYIPIHQMAKVFFILFAVTSFIAIAVSYFVAGRISHPIMKLTAFTRRFMREKKIIDIPPKTNGEVGELTEAFIQTIKDLEQSRADLVKASKLAVLGEMAAVMAHEIRTPIGILRSSAQMLSREKNLSQEGVELTSFVESETERLNKLVSTLLNSARPPTPRFEFTDIHSVIKHSVDMLITQANAKNINIQIRFKSKHNQIEVDAEQMTQVILNLVLNAIQILPKDGKVEVSTHDEQENIVINIADNGQGIPPEELQRVFDPFFTKRDGGIGLGLAVVQQIIGAHQGEICVNKSDLGGAVFTIKMPFKVTHD